MRTALASDRPCPGQAGIYLAGTTRSRFRCSLPRTGGDLPEDISTFIHSGDIAPYRRGSTARSDGSFLELDHCPVQAGIYPTTVSSGNTTTALPRTGGDLPQPCSAQHRKSRLAPYTWGSTEHLAGAHMIAAPCPIHVGIHLRFMSVCSFCKSLPRTGGDLPLACLA